MLSERFERAWSEFEAHMKSIPSLRDELASEVVEWLKRALEIKVSCEFYIAYMSSSSILFRMTL